ncbi:MAG: TonB-dependent receptor [Bacteroidales bacterium]|nr:TonB-dependent receptor [Bacteroidales bacterium]
MREVITCPQQKLVIFRKWTNKSYAVFNSLKRIIKIASLNVAYSLLALGTATSFAQEDSLRIDKKLELEEIEIISAIEPLVFSQQARLINVISKQEILRSGQQDVASILSQQRALDIRQRGGFGIQSDISLRASSFDQVLILLNGIPLSDAQTGHFSLNLPVVAQAIQRIEIIEGSAARIYGANAFAGAVNIVTQPSSKNQIQITSEGGQNAYYNLGASVNFAKGKNRTFLSYQKLGSDGYMENTDFQTNNFFMQSQWIADKYSFDFQLGAQKKKFGANGFYSAKYPLQYEYNNAYNGNANLNFGKQLVSRISMFWRRHQDQWVLTRENPSIYQNFHQTDTYGLKTNHRFLSKLGKTQIGTEIKSESIWSTSLGETQEESMPVPWNADYSFSRYFERSNASIFIDHQLNLDSRFYAAFGFLINWNSDYSQKLKIYPGIDLSYSITKKLKIIGSINQAMRLPTFTDLYYSGPANMGNTQLLPEKATSFELGLKYLQSNIQANLVYFSRLGKDVIDWVWLEDIEKWQTQNILEQNVSGIEVGIDYAPFHSSILHNIYLNYNYLDVKFKEIPQLTKYANTHLKHQLNFGGTLKLTSSLFASFSINYRDRVGVFQSYDFDNQEYQEEPYKAVLLANAKLYYERKYYTLFVDGLNLFDQKYFENGVLQPETWLKAGVTINLEAKR